MKRLPLGILLFALLALTACTQPDNPDALNPVPTIAPAALGDVIAFDMVGSASQNLNAHTNAFASAFSSAGDGFEKYQRGVSATIPFSVLDDSLVTFPPDGIGIVDDNNLDEFFGVTDTENTDNSGPVSASWSFDVSSFDAGSAVGPLTLSIDMGAMGDFETSDTFTWSYSFDSGSSQTAFASTVDETGSNSYTLAGGGVFLLDDPMLVDGTILTNSFATFSVPLSGSGDELTVTLTAITNGGTEAFAFQNLIVSEGKPLPPPVPTAVLIHEIQGSGPTSPLPAGTLVIVDGVVVGDFQGSDELNGFFLQEADADADANPNTSEGIFVFEGSSNVDVALGDVVQVTGEVAEFFGLTQITSVSDVTVVSSGNPLPTPATVTLPVSVLDDFEAFEGMSVQFPQELFVSGNFTQARFGEVDLSLGGPQEIPTNVVAPGAAANALQDLNNRSRIQLEDGSTVQNPLPLPPYLGVGDTLRTGDSVAGVTGVLSYAFGRYELHPTTAVSFTRVNARPGVPDVGGTIQVAAYNVLNYFTTLDGAGPICGPLGDQGCRGADDAFEFGQQRAKLVAAISKLDADVVGLMEIENHPGDVPTADLVAGLNAATAPGTYDFVATGAIGSDAIRVALLYQPASVTPLGGFEVLDSSDAPGFDDTLNRPMLVQTFVENATGGVFTVAVNHLKSKGSPCDGVDDPDTGDGQGNCNLTRTSAAQAIVDFLAADPTGLGDGDILIIGDLNAYAMEDPVTTIESGGYTDLIEAFVGTGFADGAYSFNFFSQSGYLDHGLSSPSMTLQVTGAAFWHVNADEPSGLDYNNFNQPLLFKPDEFRSSDHDPVLVGLDLDADIGALFGALQAEVDALEESGALNKGQANALGRKLVSAERQYDRDRTASATAILGGFIDQVNDFVADGILSADQGASLVAKAQLLQALF